MFRRHCVMARFMHSQPQLELFLFVDGDIGVVNPHNHSLFDYIQNTNNSILYSKDMNNSSQEIIFSHDSKEIDIVFYNRIFNWEISSGSYLARFVSLLRILVLNPKCWWIKFYTQETLSKISVGIRTTHGNFSAIGLITSIVCQTVSMVQIMERYMWVNFRKW